MVEKIEIELYLTHSDGKSVIAERFIRILKNKVYKYMTSTSKNVYIDKLDNKVNKCNNTYHSIIKMKPVDVKWKTYIGSSKEINNKDPKFRTGDIVRVSKYKSIFAKGYVANWSEEEVFVIKKLKILFRGYMLLVILTEKKLLEGSTKTNCKKQIKNNLELKR